MLAQINLVSGLSATRLWPSSFGRGQFISGTDQVGYATDLSGVSVHAGDMIRFEVTANGDNLYDTVSWTPSIAYISTPRLRVKLPSRIVTRSLKPTSPARNIISAPGRAAIAPRTHSAPRIQDAVRTPRSFTAN